jgi:predicted phage baseplate assembly protein
MQLANAPLTPPNAPLAAPIDVLTNLLPFTRGKTVTGEILGSGDATLAGQEFTLAKSPLTYLLSSDSSSGANYTSTLRVWVNSVEWKEQQSFYGQPANAAIFVTREDENNITHVQFGDGVNGARLPTGTNNVIANYRFGSGQVSPDAGTLTVIATPQPGLSAILNPVAAGGGSDPEPSSKIRKYAPLSVLAFGRAISGDDYEAIAASTPGVNRASAVWSFDPLQQRTVVTVYVGDDPSAQAAALLALRGDADPNRPVNVLLATQLPLQVSLTIEVAPNQDIPTVVAAAQTKLTDPDNGLFGANRIGIGEVIYKSQIYAACLSAAGAVAVHGLKVIGAPPGVNYRFDPGQGSYFSLDPVAGLKITGATYNA